MVWQTVWCIVNYCIIVVIEQSFGIVYLTYGHISKSFVHKWLYWTISLVFALSSFSSWDWECHCYSLWQYLHFRNEWNPNVTKSKHNCAVFLLRRIFVNIVCNGITQVNSGYSEVLSGDNKVLLKPSLMTCYFAELWPHAAIAG